MQLNIQSYRNIGSLLLDRTSACIPCRPNMNLKLKKYIRSVEHVQKKILRERNTFMNGNILNKIIIDYKQA